MLIAVLAVATLILAACGGVSEQEPISKYEPTPVSAAPAGSQAEAVDSEAGVRDAATGLAGSEAPAFTAAPIAVKIAPDTGSTDNGDETSEPVSMTTDGQSGSSGAESTSATVASDVPAPAPTVNAPSDDGAAADTSADAEPS